MWKKCRKRVFNCIEGIFLHVLIKPISSLREELGSWHQATIWHLKIKSLREPLSQEVGKAVTHHHHHHLCCYYHHQHQIFMSLLCCNTQYMPEGILNGKCFPYGISPTLKYTKLAIFTCDLLKDRQKFYYSETMFNFKYRNMKSMKVWKVASLHDFI